MSWETGRWASYPGDRREALLKGITSAGHDVQKIVNGKPIVATLTDAELELAAKQARPGRPPKLSGGRSKRAPKKQIIKKAQKVRPHKPIKKKGKTK